MKNILNYILIILSLTFLLQSGDGVSQYNPWGVWNKYPVNENDRIRTFSTGRYYEVSLTGLCIVKHCYEAITSGPDFPGFVIPGEYTEIEKYETIQNGFIFYLIGTGYKDNNGIPLFQKNTRIKVKMYFNNEDECYFNYVSLKDGKGFSLSYFPEENLIYKRLRVIEK